MIGVVIVEHAKSLAEGRQCKMCCIVRPAGLGGALGRLQERLVHFRCWMLVGSGGLVGVVCRVGVVAAGGVVLCCRTGACFGLVGGLLVGVVACGCGVGGLARGWCTRAAGGFFVVGCWWGLGVWWGLCAGLVWWLLGWEVRPHVRIVGNLTHFFGSRLCMHVAGNGLVEIVPV